DQITLLTSLGIVTDDNNYTGRRIEIKSTVEINTLYRNPMVLDSQSQASLPDTVLCCECGNVLKQHRTKSCEDFDGIPISGRTTNDLARLRVRRSYAPNGCRVISYYPDLERHEKTCESERISCELCQLPLSKRPPIVEHTQRDCFEYMHGKNPAGI
ncbi:unnamed protein product, partial [Rotaria socialis]